MHKWFVSYKLVSSENEYTSYFEGSMEELLAEYKFGDDIWDLQIKGICERR